PPMRRSRCTSMSLPTFPANIRVPPAALTSITTPRSNTGRRLFQRQSRQSRIEGMTPREFATDVVKKLRAAGYESLFAGGCVRDQVLGLEPDDYDVATSAHPDRVQKLFPHSIAVGAAFGVIEVLGPKPHKVQVATFRTDGPYTDARRPDHVAYSS